MGRIESTKVGGWNWAWIAAVSFLIQPAAPAADFTVASPDYHYTFNGAAAQNPRLTLVRGRTYTFQVSTSPIHPFLIYPEDGVENNDISQGTLTYHVPANAANDTVLYACSLHGFGNYIDFVDAPPADSPPTVQIVGLTVNSNLVLTSTGTNTWTPVPEYSTNLMTTNWYALTITTNRFASGTNETICGRPPADSVFLRIRSERKP